MNYIKIYKHMKERYSELSVRFSFFYNFIQWIMKIEVK